MIRANRENREWENEAWDKQTDKAGESREQAQEDPVQKRENGQTDITGKNGNHIELISIIGEIEGHENLSGNTKTTKYEHILPKLAEIEESGETEGVLVLINTVGGDVSCGLALAEMIASLSKPTVSLVIGDSHSIGVPLAVAVDHSFIVPTGTMMVHPVRMTGMVIGAVQTYDYFEMIQDRILSFVSGHSQISYERLRCNVHGRKLRIGQQPCALIKKRTVVISTILLNHSNVIEMPVIVQHQRVDFKQHCQVSREF